MIFDETNPQYKTPRTSQSRFWLILLPLILAGLPEPAGATYVAGPPEILAALKYSPHGEVLLGSPGAPKMSLTAEGFSMDESQSEIPLESAPQNPSDAINKVEGEPDPFSDEAIDAREEPDPFSDKADGETAESEDPFADDGASGDLEEDPFAEEEVEIPHMPDPLENWYNRQMFVINDHLYEYLIMPISQTYKDLVAENIRIMVRNLFTTVTFPSRLVSSLFQLDFEKAGRVIARVLINCTLGFACTVDVADGQFGIKPVEEDFGQVLGAWGIPQGPYVVLPLLGPSSVRDGIGRGVDALLNPLFWLVPDFTTGASITGGQTVNNFSFHIDDYKSLKNTAIDPYESVRDFYNQRREIQVNE